MRLLKPWFLAGSIALAIPLEILSQEIPVPASLSVGDPLTQPGNGLWAEFWQRPPASILLDGATVRENGIDRQIEGFGAPTGTFAATLFNYVGNDLTPLATWLETDAASYDGPPADLNDGAFRFTGFINIAAAGVLSIGTTTDDGSRIAIGDIDVLNNDSSHGDQSVDVDVNFEAAGVYPIEITYFNGNWTDPANPESHGGANFHLRVNGANVTAAEAGMFHRAAPKKITWVSFHSSEDSPSSAAATAGFTEAPDAGYTRLLRDNNYNVTRVVTLDNAALDAAMLNASDLVIISRSVPSGHYQSAAETAFWNSITAPVITVNGYINRLNRLGFMAADTIPDATNSVRLAVNDPSHPIFAGIELDAGNETVNLFAQDVSFNDVIQRGISVVTGAVAEGGTVLATALTMPSPSGDATGGLIIGEWQPGAVTSHGRDTFAGRRLVFLTGSREMGITSEGAGIYDLESDGTQMFLNAVAYMLTTPSALAINFASNEPSGTGSPVTGPAGALGTAVWNNVETANGSAANLRADGDGNAVVTAASVEWSSPNTWRTGASQNTAPAGNDRNLMTGYIDSNNTVGPTVTVRGIPFDNYDVYIYILGDNITAGRGGDYTIGDKTVRHLMTAPFNGTHVEGEGGNYIVIRGVSGSEFTLQTTPMFPAGGTMRAPINAIEVVASEPAPEGIHLMATDNDDGTVTIAWSGGTGPFLVQMAMDITGPWFDTVTTTQRSTTQPMISPAAFFRVQDATTRTITQFFATLNGAQENPPVDTPAMGRGSVSLEGTSLSYLVSYSGLTANASAAHFHGPAAAGTNAGVLMGIQPLTPVGTSGLYGAVGVTVDQTFIDHLNGGMTYLNIHTSNHGGGEIRGQVLPAN